MIFPKLKFCSYGYTVIYENIPMPIYIDIFIHRKPYQETMRKKISLTLDEKIWNDFQRYALKKHNNSRNANTELELAMREYMKYHPLNKEGQK